MPLVVSSQGKEELEACIGEGNSMEKEQKLITLKKVNWQEDGLATVASFWLPIRSYSP
jgi:hypothetical protein